MMSSELPFHPQEEIASPTKVLEGSSQSEEVALKKLKSQVEQLPSPRNYDHYELRNGKWDQATKTYSIQEQDQRVTTVYTFRSIEPNAQTVVRKSHRLQTSEDGTSVQIPVEYDSKNNEWRDKNILSRVKDIFLEKPVFGLITTTEGTPSEATLHVLEANRPEGPNINKVLDVTPEKLALELSLKSEYYAYLQKRAKQQLFQMQQQMNMNNQAMDLHNQAHFQAMQMHNQAMQTHNSMMGF